MKITVIGASGHAGSYLVPLLVQEGHEVTAVARGSQLPYTKKDTFNDQETVRLWNDVQFLKADRRQMEKDGSFGDFIRNTGADIVCDLICYERSQAEQVTKALAGYTQHYLCLGSIWIFGHNVYVPTDEQHPRTAIGAYGNGKVEIESYLMQLSEEKKLNCTVIHPGHIVGKGWAPLNPQGNFNPAVFQSIIRGDEITLPLYGNYTVHHVHAQDVAQLTLHAINRPEQSVSQSFLAVSPNAVTLRGFAEALYKYYGHEPAIRWLPHNEFLSSLSETDAAQSIEHLSRSPSVSPAKAARLLDFVPKYSSIDAVVESVDSLVEMRII